MKRLGFALFVAVCFAKLADAADAPADGIPPPPNCFDSLTAWLNSSAQDCPLTWNGLTLYGRIDVGAGGRAIQHRVSERRRRADFEEQPWIAVCPRAKWAGPVQRRRQRPRADRRRMVARLQLPDGFRSLYVEAGRRSQIAGAEQRDGARFPNRKRQLEPRRPDLQYCGLCRRQQPNVGHADCGPAGLAHSGRPCPLRRHGGGARLFRGRCFEYGGGRRRHGGRALQHVSPVPGEYRFVSPGRALSIRRLRSGKRFERRI